MKWNNGANLDKAGNSKYNVIFDNKFHCDNGISCRQFFTAQSR